MLENPAIPESLISACVEQAYGLDVQQVNFLPLGYDVNSAVYRLETSTGSSYFLKLRKGPFEQVTVTLPQFLYRQGVSAIIPPMQTRHGQLYESFEQYTAVLYPFIQGRDGYQVILTDLQWIALGKTLRLVHQTQLPRELILQIPGEIYDPQWRDRTRQFLTQVEQGGFADPIAAELGAFLAEKREVISHMVDRADALAMSLRGPPLEFVLCHSDAHPGNYLVSDSGELYLVDWDNPVFAPKERDLMCIASGMSGYQPGGIEEQLFYQGYGAVEVNQQALAYYRFERVIQDIAEFCKQILLTESAREDRAQSLRYLTSSFLPGAVVGVAIQTDRRAGTTA